MQCPDLIKRFNHTLESFGQVTAVRRLSAFGFRQRCRCRDGGQPIADRRRSVIRGDPRREVPPAVEVLWLVLPVARVLQAYAVVEAKVLAVPADRFRPAS